MAMGRPLRHDGMAHVEAFGVIDRLGLIDRRGGFAGGWRSTRVPLDSLRFASMGVPPIPPMVNVTATIPAPNVTASTCQGNSLCLLNMGAVINQTAQTGAHLKPTAFCVNPTVHNITRMILMGLCFVSKPDAPKVESGFSNEEGCFFMLCVPKCFRDKYRPGGYAARPTALDGQPKPPPSWRASPAPDSGSCGLPGPIRWSKTTY